MKRSTMVKRGFGFCARSIGGIIHLALKIAISVVLVVLMTGLIFALIFATYVKNSLSDELDVKLSDFSLAQTSIVYCWDEDAQDYVELERLSGLKKSTWVNYEDIPADMEHAAVAIEDHRFYEHHGVDWYRTAGAFGSMFLSMSNNFGGSTITQQLIKNLTEYDEVTVQRKLLEIFRALKFEKTYSKEEIMEWYLNKIYLGEGCWGVAAAANEYFGKDVQDLTLAECACIIGITNNPSMYDPYIDKQANKDRQEIILAEMKRWGYITEEEYQKAKRQRLVFTHGRTDAENTADIPDEEHYTSWFVDALIEDVIQYLMEDRDISYKTAEQMLLSGGYKIYATMDPRIQAIVDEVYSTRDNLPQGYRLSNYQELESALVLLDPFTGDIKAMAGGIGEKTGSRIYNLATQGHRSPGSSIKPIASYGPAMELGVIMPYSLYLDAASVKLKGTTWFPNNDDGSNSGLINIRYALQRSKNTIAAQLIDDITPQVSYNFLTQRLGMNLVEEQNGMTDIAYAALSLGELTNGVTVREMASAYTAFINDGIFTKGRTFSRIEDSQGNLIYDNVPQQTVAFSPITAYYMRDMLENAVNTGTGTPARLSSMPAAGKTGSSNDWRDRWFVGFTPYYVAAAWSGYRIPENMGSSSNPAAGMWKQVMEKVNETLELESVPFPRPENMTLVTVCPDTGLLATSACHADIRGDRTMSLYIENSKVPSQYCPCHVMTELCSVSMALPSANCPADSVKSYSVLDLSKATTTVRTPPYYADSYCYAVKDAAAIEASRVHYVLGELEECTKHVLDPESGWYVDTSTGYLINPRTGMYYDTVNDLVIDQFSGWVVDWKTGALIDPNTGGLIDPYTGGPFTPATEIDEYSPDILERPPNYAYRNVTPERPPEEEEPGEETGGETGGEEPGPGGETGGEGPAPGGETGEGPAPGGEEPAPGGETGGEEPAPGGETGGEGPAPGGETGSEEPAPGGEEPAPGGEGGDLFYNG